MKMNISFTLIGTGIVFHTIYDLASNPFSLGDEIYLNVYDLTVKDLEPYSNSNGKGESFKRLNGELQTDLDRKKVKLVKEGKYVALNYLTTKSIDIEYEVMIVEE
jgi:hypothetical protein